MKKLRIYLDNCCYYRPFDNLTQHRVLIEAEAVLAIVKACEQGKYSLIGSEVLDIEMSETADVFKREKALLLYSAASTTIIVTDKVVKRAKELQAGKIRPLDSLHLASAESANVDVFLTTDDDLIKWAKDTNVRIKVMNPVNLFMEVSGDE